MAETIKRVLIFSHNLELGGAERSLIGLLQSLDPEKCRVDLFLMRHTGEMMGDIPNYVNLLPQVSGYTVLARPMKDTLREGHLLLTAARLAGKIAAGLYDRRKGLTESGVALEYSHKFTRHFLAEIQLEVEYDLAISFLTPHYCVAEKVRARKKIAWIHTDYSKVRVDTVSEEAMWSRYDHIVTISDAVSESFTKTFPQLAGRLIPLENILPERLIRRQAAEFSAEGEMPSRGIRILSIGRFCHAKNFDNVPGICRRLVEMGLDIAWYLIGYGPDETLIRGKIAEAGMEKRVILLGKKENPYPYIQNCDLYVQPSRYEGKSVTVREAQMLGKPVVITRYPTSASQLEDGVDGIIVPLDNEGCACGIAALLQNPAKMQALRETCKARNYSNASEVEKLYELMEIV